MNMTIDRMHTPGRAATDAPSSAIVVKDVTSEEFCELCLSRRTLWRSDVDGLRGLFEPATRTQFVERPRLQRRTPTKA
ncbi:MAG TPA: hypothetical protein VML55_01270 [Planctomycetaceae bacterium]|nr:hypothetical protein [Planctomycetaceae bacterium]